MFDLVDDGQVLKSKLRNVLGHQQQTSEFKMLRPCLSWSLANSNFFYLVSAFLSSLCQEAVPSLKMQYAASHPHSGPPLAPFLWVQELLLKHWDLDMQRD